MEQVLTLSSKASATLSRYILQKVLHEELNIREKNLKEELDKLESKQNIPANLCKMLQIMRRVANFAAHPKKLTNSNEIIEVEKGESEIMLELLLELFDFIFVKPAHMQSFENEIEEKYGIKVK